MWHEDTDERKRIGEQMQDLFQKSVRCSCGGKFKFIGDLQAGFPDFTCDYCSQLVDVKSSPQAERTGNLSVSAIPWNNYPDDVLLVTRIKGRWLGEFKRNIATINAKANEPTHKSQHESLKNTQWFLISWRVFSELETLGYGITNL